MVGSRSPSTVVMTSTIGEFMLDMLAQPGLASLYTYSFRREATCST